MWVFFTSNAVHEIYMKRSADMYFVHTCIFIILALSFSNAVTKKIVKVIEDDI